MFWVLLTAIMILCAIIHVMRTEIDDIKRVQIHMYKLVCKEDFDKAKAMYYEKYGDDKE